MGYRQSHGHFGADMKKILLWFTLLFSGCVGLPENIVPVDDFHVERYLGKWYEIARLDHSFERGLTSVTAEYSLRPDGGIRVDNRGYSAKEGKWKWAEGKAYFAARPDQGFLRVSFFGPFYGSYVILELDRDRYSYALVCGPDRSYLWILARSPRLDDDVRKHLVEKASRLGFDTGQLIFIPQDGG
jgi:apolipoprotein D and lipocalin family protein